MDYGKSFTNESSNSDSSERKKLSMSRQIALEKEKEDINKMADAFINNFRKQLKIERENSFRRFQDMMNRGAQ
ncbi:hypothetical protein LR48_Vigan01g052700 [Vigna angularis]|uniref:Uncharacterized protein n=2 Tax=Phaseolus angularis TaxID=3914 RepID=A0A0L9TKM2_PHAAN|nr:hypothetical protein LR48_Vigan01g052700 [Vigna angularis]BAT73669.1 hypothetical protein VIGAN_01118300 [Vigna angularis var. angularis]